jgi:ribA/ribD-fused uncharacterized protein
MAEPRQQQFPDEEERYSYGQCWVDRRGRACRTRRNATMFHIFENEFPTPTEYEGQVYPSAFHAFQAARYSHELRAPLAARAHGSGRAMSVHEARAYGARTDLPILPAFVARRAEIMRAILRAKFGTSHKLLFALLRTGSRPLVYDSKCPVWGCGPGDKDKGRNLHGELLAAVRDEIRGEVAQLDLARASAADEYDDDQPSAE